MLHIAVSDAEEEIMETIVRHRDEGSPTWFLNGLMTTKAEIDETGGAYCLMEHVLTPACDPPMHVHANEEEAFYVLEGEIDFEVDGAVVSARPGTFALAPRGRPHRFEVRTPVARVLVLTSAAGAVGGGARRFFSAAGEPAPSAVLPEPQDPDPVRLTALAAEHGITILPPPGA